MGGRAGEVEGTRGDGRWSRRRWLAWGAIGLVAGPRSLLGAPPPTKAALTADDEKIVEAVRARAGKAGLGEFQVTKSEHFLAVGDGPAAYRAAALDRSERIARDYFVHFRHIGFDVAFPARRLAVVALQDARSYQSFSGDEEPDETVGGHYDPDPNWLVIFDFRTVQGRANAEAKRINTFTLVHETIHLLCYNTGLQTARGDVPACISEGLATYGELWVPGRGSSAFGMVNGPRLRVLLTGSAEECPWIPIAQLLADDDFFRKPETAQLAYAEAWLLVHLMLDGPERRPKFRAYLAGIPGIDARPAIGRVKYAESALGSPDALDLAVRRHAQRMGKKAGLRIPARLTRGRG